MTKDHAGHLVGRFGRVELRRFLREVQRDRASRCVNGADRRTAHARALIDLTE